jgi:hypothetical protein
MHLLLSIHWALIDPSALGYDLQCSDDPYRSRRILCRWSYKTSARYAIVCNRFKLVITDQPLDSLGFFGHGSLVSLTFRRPS